MLSPKEAEIIKILEESKKSNIKLTSAQIAEMIKSPKPYISQQISKLVARSMVKFEQKDNRSKYVLLNDEPDKEIETKVEYKVDPVSQNLALKLVSFFLTHSNQMRAPLRTKLLGSFTDKDREFINQNSNRIEELELTWEES